MSKVVVTASRLERRKKINKYLKRITLILMILFAFLYIILAIIYNGGNFTITLDPTFSADTGIVLYENREKKEIKNRLYAEEIDSMDNISIKWIPDNINDEKDGAHNGDNYIAYTFYLENEGKEEINYWVECTIDDVIRRIDEAVRIMVILNGDKVVYAKENSLTKMAEDGTEKFYKSKVPVLRKRSNFKSGDIDKYTIVVWVEGDDPDCVDALIGGEIKMHLDIRDEHISNLNKEKKKQVKIWERE